MFAHCLSYYWDRSRVRSSPLDHWRKHQVGWNQATTSIGTVSCKNVGTLTKIGKPGVPTCGETSSSSSSSSPCHRHQSPITNPHHWGTCMPSQIFLVLLDFLKFQKIWMTKTLFGHSGTDRLPDESALILLQI